MGAEQYEGYDRISAVLGYFYLPDMVKRIGKVGMKEWKRSGTVAMKFGTEVDEWIKAHVTGGKLPKIKSDEVQNCVNAYLLWEKEYGYKVEVGKRVFNETQKVTGEPDLLTSSTVIDVKCSIVIRPQYWMQTEWYGRQTGKVCKAILRLDKHLGVYEYQEKNLDLSCYDAVNGLIEAYKWFNITQESLTESEENDDVTDTNSTDTEAGSEKDLA